MKWWQFPQIESSSRSSRSTPSENNVLSQGFLPSTKIWAQRKLPTNFFTGVLLLAIAALFGLVLRLATLQLINGQKNLAFSEGNRIRRERIKAARGLVFDREGVILARNLPTFSLIYNPALCSQARCGLDPLRRLPHFEAVLARFEKNQNLTTPFVLASGLTRDEILLLGNLDDWAFLQIEADQVRSYPDDHLFSHLIGYLGEASAEELSDRSDLLLGDSLGKDGVERVYDRDLQGVSGYNLVEVDASQRSRRFLGRKEAVSGRSLVLTVSRSLQRVADEALREAAKKAGSCCGAVVVEDVRSGAILSLVSQPDFDLNLFSQSGQERRLSELLNDPSLPFFNRAVAGSFAVGSVFKPVVAAAALSEKIIAASTLLEAPGAIRIGDFSYGDWKPGGHGLINIERALAESADTFFYQIGGGYEGQRGLGAQKIAHYARLFGLGSRSLIDLPQEAAGLVPDPEWKKRVKGEDWYLGNTYHLSIGQGDLLATPLQMAQMVSAVANGGVLLRPYLLEKIVDDTGKVYYQASSNHLRERFIDPSVLKMVREGMRQAGEEGGTAYPFFNFKVAVGAKTGTAEPGGEVSPHAWFTVFAPFESPEVVVTVLVENGGQGADVAAPVARKILEEYFKDR